MQLNNVRGDSSFHCNNCMKQDDLKEVYLGKVALFLCKKCRIKLKELIIETDNEDIDTFNKENQSREKSDCSIYQIVKWGDFIKIYELNEAIVALRENPSLIFKQILTKDNKIIDDGLSFLEENYYLSVYYIYGGLHLACTRYVRGQIQEAVPLIIFDDKYKWIISDDIEPTYTLKSTDI